MHEQETHTKIRNQRFALSLLTTWNVLSACAMFRAKVLLPEGNFATFFFIEKQVLRIGNSTTKIKL